MKINTNMKTVLIGATLLAMLCFLTGAVGCNSSKQAGRYQLVANPSNPFVIDTVTGQAWESGTGMLRSSKAGHRSAGKIGRFKGVVIGEDNYIIDTATGRVWSPGTGMFRHSKN